VREERLIRALEDRPRLARERVGHAGVADRTLDLAPDQQRGGQRERIGVLVRLVLHAVGERLCLRDLSREHQRLALEREQPPAVGRKGVGARKECGNVGKSALGVAREVGFDFVRALGEVRVTRRMRLGEREQDQRRHQPDDRPTPRRAARLARSGRGLPQFGGGRH